MKSIQIINKIYILAMVRFYFDERRQHFVWESEKSPPQGGGIPKGLYMPFLNPFPKKTASPKFFTSLILRGKERR